MSKEKIILSSVAVLVGLAVAGAAFYFYQGTKTLTPSEQKSQAVIKPTPSPTPSVTLVLNEPQDEKVYDNRVVKISGKTDPDAYIVILMPNDYDVLTPSGTGDFSTTMTIENGTTLIQVTAVAKNGDTNTKELTVNYSTESF